MVLPPKPAFRFRSSPPAAQRGGEADDGSAFGPGGGMTDTEGWGG